MAKLLLWVTMDGTTVGSIKVSRALLVHPRRWPAWWEVCPEDAPLPVPKRLLQANQHPGPPQNRHPSFIQWVRQYFGHFSLERPDLSPQWIRSRESYPLDCVLRRTVYGPQ